MCRKRESDTRGVYCIVLCCVVCVFCSLVRVNVRRNNVNGGEV